MTKTKYEEELERELEIIEGDNHFSDFGNLIEQGACSRCLKATLLVEKLEGYKKGREEALKEVKKMIDELKWELRDIDNKYIEQALEYSGNEVFMDMHNEDLEELKQKLKELGD